MNNNRKQLLEYVLDGDTVILGPGRAYPLGKMDTFTFVVEMIGLFVAAFFASGIISENSSVIVVGIFFGCVIYMFGYKRRKIYKQIRDSKAADTFESPLTKNR